MQKPRLILAIAIMLLALATIFVACQFIIVGRAHSSFENYYAFRGCRELIAKTDSYATCRLASGEVIKIVKYQDKWYLDGDLPVCWLGKSLCW